MESFFGHFLGLGVVPGSSRDFFDIVMGGAGGISKRKMRPKMRPEMRPENEKSWKKNQKN